MSTDLQRTVLLDAITVYVSTDWQRDRVAEIAAIDAAVADWSKLGREMVRRELYSCATLVNTLDTTGTGSASSRRFVARTLAAVRAFVDEHNAATAPRAVAALTLRQRELVCTAIRVHMLQLDEAGRHGVGAALFPLDERNADMQALADALFALDPGPGAPTLPIVRNYRVALPGDPNA
jgi:hypothetical protein